MDESINLIKVCDKTIEEKYTIPDVHYDFFGYEEGKGIFVKDSYAEVTEKFEHIDMMYDRFDWQNGVGYYALIEAGKKLKTNKYFNFFKEWVDLHLEKGLPSSNINTTAPFLSIIEIYNETKEQKYYDLCAERASFLMKQATRTEDGIYEHTVTRSEIRNKSQLWADTIFMGVLFLARWGSLERNHDYIKEAAEQLIGHYKYLYDHGTGLLFHGYNAITKNNMSAVRWGRANAWGILSSHIILKYIPEDWPEHKSIQNIFFKHVKDVANYQNDDGSFCTVLDNYKTYKETTITSSFCYGVNQLVEKGLADEELIEQGKKARAYLINQIAGDGTVNGASGGTPLMSSVNEYNKIPCVMSYYGQGMMILALI